MQIISHQRLLVVCFLFNIVVLIGVVSYGGLYLSDKIDMMADRIDELNRSNVEMEYEILKLKQQEKQVNILLALN